MFSFCILALLSVLNPALSCINDQYREMEFPSYYFFGGQRLINHVIRTIKALDHDSCELQCYMEHNCVSINFEFTGTHNCDLNNSTHKEHEKDLVKTQGYIYHGTQNACGRAPCQNNATCQTGFTRKGYRCLCTPGFTGHHCDNDIDECTEDTHNCSKEGGLCVNTKGSFNCSCKPGYTGDGHNCIDINECPIGFNNNCSEHAYCNNTAESYNCTCRDGYFGNGYNCIKSVFAINSTILSDNRYYLNHLRRFLVPAVGHISEWVLCYRQSVHGDLDSDFHLKCDGKENTVSIVKENEFVFGGYTDISLESNVNQYSSTSNAFIFSLHNNENLAPFKSMVINPDKAIYNHIYKGPTFGTEDIGIDKDGTSKTAISTTNIGTDYSVPNGVNNRTTILAGVQQFYPDEVEVFYLKVT